MSLTVNIREETCEQDRFGLAVASLENVLDEETSNNHQTTGRGDDSQFVDEEEGVEKESEEEDNNSKSEEEDIGDNESNNDDEEEEEEEVEEKFNLYTFYARFLDHFMPAVKGEKKWKQMRQGCCNNQSIEFDLNEHATISDEAFLLVCLENYSAVWEHQFKQRHSTIQEAEGSNTYDTNEEGEKVSFIGVLNQKG